MTASVTVSETIGHDVNKWRTKLHSRPTKNKKVVLSTLAMSNLVLSDHSQHRRAVPHWPSQCKFNASLSKHTKYSKYAA